MAGALHVGVLRRLCAALGCDGDEGLGGQRCQWGGGGGTGGGAGRDGGRGLLVGGDAGGHCWREEGRGKGVVSDGRSKVSGSWTAGRADAGSCTHTHTLNQSGQLIIAPDGIK